jgi:adenylosuccinate lyase/1-aminocyclopropane-1-carboxylate deaminase/D-cysteine desulfhydrase-like pyridoxal-dependent ACC family enzyme
VGAVVIDSTLYRHLWATEEASAIFEEPARLRAWLGILATLADAQAELGLVPAEAARAIRTGAVVERLDLAFVASETRRTGHSTLGLIRGLQRVLPASAAEWVYYGATVQDLTDTWTGLAMRSVGAILWRDLRAVEGLLLALAERHRDTLMAGRTHGQVGSPTTFGLKAASWADEVGRHIERRGQGAPRWLVGQLAGAVGTLAFFGQAGPELRRRFCERLGLADPGVSWTSSRDRLAEFATLLALVGGTLARIGNEVYQLQRPEIGELREPTRPGAVGSITMPHKRNPEAAEHLVTLWRLVRATAGTGLESMVQEHERDGRGWKAEWVAFPEASLLTATALDLTRRLLEGLEVDEPRMAANALAGGGVAASEALLVALSPRIGKHRAQDLLQQVLEAARRQPAARLAAELAGPPILVKRDDLTGFALAGNKARKLEYLLGDARATGADVLLTGGGPSSNHCQAAAAAARVAGLACELVLYGEEPGRPRLNLELARRSGARVAFTGDPDRASVDAALAVRAEQLRAAGCRPYVIPRGGATPLGAVGYALAVPELAGQLAALGTDPEVVLVATGSCGTQAGLVAGTVAAGRGWRVVGAAVSRPPAECRDRVLRLARGCAALLDLPVPEERDVELVDARGPGYGVASTEGEAAARLAAATEGLLLDPVFTAKAMAALVATVGAGLSGPAVFVHTGGTPVALQSTVEAW